MTHHEFSIASVSSAAPDEPRFRSRDYLELTTILVRLFRNRNYQPPVFPKLAMELYQACCQSHLPAREVAKVVGRDPLLAGQVFSAAQNTAFGGVPAPRTLPDAVTRLGNRRTAEIALRHCRRSCKRVPNLRVPAHRTLEIGEEEGPVSLDRSPDRSAELVAPDTRDIRCERIARVVRVVLIELP